MHTCGTLTYVLSKGRRLNGESFEPYLQALPLSTNISQSEKSSNFENFPFDLPKLRVEPKVHQELRPRVCILSLYIRVQRLYLGIKALTVVFSFRLSLFTSCIS